MAQQAVTRIAPTGAHLKTTTDGEEIEVEVTADTHLPGLVVTATAFAIAEPTEETPQ
jgi:hypothetical protein